MGYLVFALCGRVSIYHGLKEQYGEKFELVFISADFEEARAEATDFKKEQGVNFTTFFKQGKDNDFIAGISENGLALSLYTLILDKNGATYTEWEGKADYKDFEDAIHKSNRIDRSKSTITIIKCKRYETKHR